MANWHEDFEDEAVSPEQYTPSEEDYTDYEEYLDSLPYEDQYLDQMYEEKYDLGDW